jgi:hypothetical protein
LTLSLCPRSLCHSLCLTLSLKKYCVLCGYVPIDGAPSVLTTDPPLTSHGASKKGKVDGAIELFEEGEEEAMSSYAKKRYRELCSTTSIASLTARESDETAFSDSAVTDILSKVTLPPPPPSPLSPSLPLTRSQKLCWVAKELEREQSLERSLQLAVLMKALAEGKMAMKSLVSESSR